MLENKHLVGGMGYDIGGVGIKTGLCDIIIIDGAVKAMGAFPRKVHSPPNPRRPDSASIVDNFLSLRVSRRLGTLI